MTDLNKQFDDSEVRLLALSVDQSFIVQAPAGSGKTSLLVYRILNLLLTVDRPEQVLAITFTKKATAEMRQRVIELLEMAERGEQGNYPLEQYALGVAQQVLLRNEQNNWNLLESPDQLQILTIDSFCARLTANMPWLSRLGDKPRTTEKTDEHYGAAVEQLMACLLEKDNVLSQPLQTVMASLDFNYQLARKLFIEMLGKRDQWLRHLLQHDEAVLKDELQTTWQQVTETHLQYLQSLLPTDTQQQLFELGKAASEVLSQQDKNKNIFVELDAYQQLPRQLDLPIAKAFKNLLLTGSNSYRKTINATAGFKPKSDEKEKLLSLLQDFQGDETLQDALIELDILPSQYFSETDWHELMALKTVLIALAGFLQLRFRATGEVDFNEVTHRANLALSELQQPTDLALRLDYQIQHILVDEFQDTSHSQIELLKKLTAAWDHSSPNQTNTLFLVGDPMQSIYRFREADVGLFLRVADDALRESTSGVFDNLHLQSLTLSENYRSNKSLVDWFNATFAKSFPERDDVMQGAISYSPATSSKAEVNDPVRLQIAQDKTEEVDALVTEVQQALSEMSDKESLNKESKKVAILVQARSQLATILPALQKANIGYLGVDLQTLDATPAIIDIVSLCRALSRLDDRIAWLALLRGPWCGMMLAEMKQVIQSDTDSDVWSLLQQQLQKQLKQKKPVAKTMTNFMDVMAIALEQKGRVSLHALTYWAWQQLGGQATLGETAQEDAELVFSLLGELEKGGDIDSVATLEKSLEALYAKSHNTDAQVVISTIHKAKGLQYDTVILPGLNRKAPNLNKSMMVWAEEVDARGHSKMLMAGYRLIKEQGSHYDYLQALERKREQHQTMRLMYVACTRAERKLVLMANLGLDKNDNLKSPIKNSLLATVWPAVQDSAVLLPGNQAVLDETALSQTLYRLKDDFELQLATPVQWQGQQQLIGKPDDEQDYEAEFEWATSLATAVGVVLHDWLQVHQSQVMQMKLDDTLEQQWRAALLAQRLPAERLPAAIERLKLALESMQNDANASFIFNDYQEQHNEYALATFEDALVKTYRIDRTFVDNQGMRWIIDYKTTYTEQSNTSQFVDEQMERHKDQLHKYGELMSALDERPIKLAVYFPLLKEFRSWDYQQ